MVLWSLAPVLRAGVKRTGTDFYGLVRTPAAEFSAAAIRIDTRNLYGWCNAACRYARVWLGGATLLAGTRRFGLGGATLLAGTRRFGKCGVACYCKSGVIWSDLSDRSDGSERTARLTFKKQ